MTAEEVAQEIITTYVTTKRVDSVQAALKKIAALIEVDRRDTERLCAERVRALKVNAENDMPKSDFIWDRALDKAIAAITSPAKEDSHE